MNQPGARKGVPAGSILIEVSPDGPGLTGPADGTGDVMGAQAGLATRLRTAYDDRAARYNRELGSVTTGDPASATTRYPELPVTLDSEETLVVDGELFEQLFDVYVYHGWAGIRRVEEAIARLVPSTPSGGTSDSAWGPAASFFLFTRNVLAMLIRDALEELERRAATRMIPHLSEVAAQVSNAWARYRIVRTEKTEAMGGKATKRVVTYSFGDQAESKALFAALTQAVQQRTAHEELLQQVARVKDQVQALRDTTQRFRKRGKPLSSERQLTSELDLKERELKQLDEGSVGLLNAMKAVIKNNSPLGLLVLEGLTPGFTQSRMEELLGATLWELYDHLDTLGTGIDPRRSLTAATLAGVSAVEFDALPEVQRTRVPNGGPEAAVVDAAFRGVGSEPAWFPLLHEPTLHLLCESGEIPRDSFTFVVFAHYITALGERLEAEEASEAFWRSFARVAAAASLILLATPAAGLGLVLRSAAGIANLVLMAYAVSSVTQQLARLDQLRDHHLLDPDAFLVEGLGRLGQLGIYRQQVLEGITQQLLIELVLVALGASWAPIKRLLIVRSYLQDVETIFGPD